MLSAAHAQTSGSGTGGDGPGNAAAAAGGEGASGLPQLNFDTYANQIFWLIVALVAIWWLLSRVALPRIASVLAERQGTITNDIAAAEDLKARAREAEEAYEKALADAREEARRIAEETRAEIREEAEKREAEAEERIAEKQAKSEERIAEIRQEASDAVDRVAKSAAAEIVAQMGVEAEQGQIDRAVEARTEG